MKHDLIQLAAAVAIGAAGGFGPVASAAEPVPAGLGQDSGYFSPTALAATAAGQTLFVAGATANRVAVLDVASMQITRNIAVPDPPLGLALSRDGSRLYVACAAPASTVCVVEVGEGKIVRQILVGHTAMAPVLSPDQQTLYVCNRFENDIACIDLVAGREFRRIRVAREPVAAAVTPDGKWLLVANHLPAGRADTEDTSAVVSVIDTAAGRVVKEIKLPSGSGLVRDLRISPDGRYACVTHILARFLLHALSADEGWINSNAMSLIDLAPMALLNTVLLDEDRNGAANPWAAAWTADGKRLCVTHAGTHELSVIDVPGLLEKLAGLPDRVVRYRSPRLARFEPYHRLNHRVPARTKADVFNDLGFLAGLRERVQLDGVGPRAMVVAGGLAYVANYFSDSIDVVDLEALCESMASIPLGPWPEMSVVRQGEMWFNDGTLCRDGWQSCASCHDADARVDGLNWDLPNDRLGNPKNSKSLLWSHRTPPAMAMGVRASAEVAVRAGIRGILFADPPAEIPVAMDEYLKALRPIPSPYLREGKLSAAAERGKEIFHQDQTGCARCHPGPLFTDLRSHDVGTRNDNDRATDRLDTPTLVELWRTAPYLHAGAAPTLREVLTTANPEDRHGRTSHLSLQEVDDLVEYLLSL